MGALSKLAIVLTVVFAVSVTALLAQLVCVKWRKRQFRRRSLSTGDRETNSSTAGALTNFYPPSKELLYFFCWRNQSRVEPDGRAPGARPSRTEPDEIDDILKWHGAIYGPPRFLFTINEDQEREVEPELDGIDNVNSSSRASAPPAEEMKKKVSLRECLEEPESTPVAEAEAEAEAEADDRVAVAVVSVEEATPFTTPCASPPYFTPSPSPARDHRMAMNTEDTADFAVPECEAPEFTSLEVRGHGVSLG